MTRDLPTIWGRLGQGGDPFANLMRPFESLFDDAALRRLPPAVTLPTPRLDVTADAEAITVKADLPGMAENEVEVTLEGDTLIIRGERKNEREEKDEKKAYVVQERSYGAFQRAIGVGPDIDRDKVTASFDKGVLVVKLPKTQAAKAAARRIDVKAA
ncbi:MAG: Hsp20/alpha crystallin family protein [Rhodospirillales bacterium]|nr:MAG: Hsp20/alpha crystallin family protein [Rhodospirillales bacterium]